MVIVEELDQGALSALPFQARIEWRSRWVQMTEGRSTSLHRVAQLDDPAAWTDMPYGTGRTVCGLRGSVGMPGFISRMSAPRCRKCCKALGVPRGNGAPYNDRSLDEKARAA